MTAKMGRLFHERYVPKMQPHLRDGFASTQVTIESQIPFIDAKLRDAAAQFPAGITYQGCMPCTPHEEYQVCVKPRNNGVRKGDGGPSSKRTYDIARSDVVLVKMFFSLAGVKLPPQYTYLAFSGQAGLSTLSGKTWMFNPVLADNMFSVEEDHLFMMINRAKLTFRKLDYSVRVNGRVVAAQVFYSPLHNDRNKKNNSPYIKLGHVHTTLTHYLFSKMGVENTFKTYFGFMPEMNKYDVLRDKYGNDPGYIIYTSTGIKPDKSKLRIDEYAAISTEIAFAVPIEKNSQALLNYIAGFYYVVDLFPTLMPLEWVHEQYQWKRLLGHVLWGVGQGDGKSIENIEQHLNSLDGYIDESTRREWIASAEREDDQFFRVGHCNNIYDLFDHIIRYMMMMMSHGASRISSMYGKRLTVLRYLLSGINNEIFQLLFDLNSNSKKQHTPESVTATLARHIRPRIIFGVISGQGHAEVSIASCPQDIYLHKITSCMIPQSATGTGGDSHGTEQMNAKTFLHSSVLEIGSIMVLPKSCPDGRAKINPYANVDPVTGDVGRWKRHYEKLNRLQQRIQR